MAVIHHLQSRTGSGFSEVMVLRSAPCRVLLRSTVGGVQRASNVHLEAWRDFHG